MPYELDLIDLKELNAKLRLDKDNKFYVEIHNPKYSGVIKSPHLKDKKSLTILLKLELYNYKIRIKAIRYCSVCGHNLIMDSRKYVNICPECMNNPPVSVVIGGFYRYKGKLVKVIKTNSIEVNEFTTYHVKFKDGTRDLLVASDLTDRLK
jgi:hypothetical protein